MIIDKVVKYPLLKDARQTSEFRIRRSFDELLDRCNLLIVNGLLFKYFNKASFNFCQQRRTDFHRTLIFNFFPCQRILNSLIVFPSKHKKSVTLF